MIVGAGLHCIADAGIGFLTKFKIPIDEVNIEVSNPFVEIVVPDLHSNHKMPPLLPSGVEDKRNGIVSIGATSWGQDAHHIEGIEHSVGESRH